MLLPVWAPSGCWAAPGRGASYGEVDPDLSARHREWPPSPRGCLPPPVTPSHTDYSFRYMLLVSPKPHMFRLWWSRFPHQEVVGDRAQLLVSGYSQADQEVAHDGEHGDDELGGDIKPFKTGLVSVRHLCCTATRSHIHDERVTDIPQKWKTWKNSIDLF